jgi:osmotically inducible protein OsmC
MMKPSAQAVWQGGLAKGSGLLTTPSQVLADTPYSFATRFGDEPGTNPEELIAAAHAGCYSMALAFLLGQAGLSPQTIRTTADLTVVNSKASWTVTAIHLTVSAVVPGAGDDAFRRIAEQARTGCLVSRLVNATVTLDAQLESPGSAPV